jgi:hypothetical protein
VEIGHSLVGINFWIWQYYINERNMNVPVSSISARFKPHFRRTKELPKSGHRKSRDRKLPWPEMTSPEVTVPALFSYYSSSTKCTIAHSEQMDPNDDPKYSYDSPDIYIYYRTALSLNLWHRVYCDVIDE